MASEARVTTDSIRKSARQLMQEYRAGRSIEGDDVANIAHDLEDAAAEIARLARELEATRAALRIAQTTAANLHDTIRLRDRELEEARERERGARRAFEVAMEYVHESLYGDILVRLAEEGIDLTALSTPQEVSDG